MADTKISSLATDSAPSGSDYILTVDVSDTTAGSTGTNKKVTAGSLPIGTAAQAALDGLAAGLAAKQDGSAKLSALAGLTWAADSIAYLTGTATAAVASLSAFMRGLLGSADAAAARSSLGLGTAATTAATAYATAAHVHATAEITSGTLVVARGGTGLSTIAPGNLLYASATDTLSALALGTNLSITGGALNASGGGGGSIASTSSVLKGDGAGAAVAATAGTDFVKPTGVSGGQAVSGDTASGGSLTLSGTSHATKGPVYFNGTAALVDASGNFSRPGGSNSEQFGASASAPGSNCTAIGKFAVTSGPNSTAIGSGCSVTEVGGSGSVGIGASLSLNGSGNVAVGNSIAISGSTAVAIGVSNTVTNGLVSIGNGCSAGNFKSIAIGLGVTASHVNSAAIGAGVATTRDRELVLGGSQGNGAGTSLIGYRIRVMATTSTDALRDAGIVSADWKNSTDASRAGGITLYACDFSGTDREGLRVSSDGTQALLSFYGKSPAVARAATPSTLADVIALLQAVGLCS